MHSVVGRTTDTHKSYLFSHQQRPLNMLCTISIPRALFSEAVVKNAAPSKCGSGGVAGRRKHIKDESALHRESYIGRPRVSEEGGRTGQLALL